MNEFIQLFLSLTLAAVLFGGVAVPVYADDDVSGAGLLIVLIRKWKGGDGHGHRKALVENK